MRTLALHPHPIRARLPFFLAALLMAMLAGYALWLTTISHFFVELDGMLAPQAAGQRSVAQDPAADAITTIAQDLRVPWEMAFLPDGDVLLTERTGTLRRLGAFTQAIDISSVVAQGEGGLLGMALDPNYRKNSYLYLYATVEKNGNVIARVTRYAYNGTELLDEKILLDDIPAGIFHVGGRLRFGPDNMLYVTTGDAGSPALAQDTKSLAGKILRIQGNGTIPKDNPFGNAVWSFGHRNPQGLAWDAQGRLWETEHGRSGLQSGLDELNLIEKGGNYGWPVIQGNERREGMKSPIVHSGAAQTWAPAAIEAVEGGLVFAGLRGASLYAVRLSAEGAVLRVELFLTGVYGRLRIVRVGPDGALYIATSNTDGRGNPREGDDKLTRIAKEEFSKWMQE